MRTHAALACSGRSAVLVRRVQARFGGSAPRRAAPTAPYLPSSADSAARQIWRMSVLTKLRPQACHARGVTSHMRGNACEQWEHARDMLGHVVHLDSLRRESVAMSGSTLQQLHSSRTSSHAKKLTEAKLWTVERKTMSKERTRSELAGAAQASSRPWNLFRLRTKTYARRFRG